MNTPSSEDRVDEPQAAYTRKEERKRVGKGVGSKRYDAKRYTGMIPGIAERMKEYLKHVRDDR